MLKINTKDILFICGGAFVGLDKVIDSRISQHPLGFGADVKLSSEKDLETLYAQMHPEDLIKFGLIPEFIGRLPIHVALSNLSKEDLMRIISEPRNSVLKQYKASMSLDEVTLTFETDAIEAIAEKAIEQKTGARGLRSIVENIMTDIMYEIPSLEGKKEVIINREVVDMRKKPEVVYNKKTA
jgi:ATP-dependent Clp protease ATP-binding subunit ClpX